MNEQDLKICHLALTNLISIYNKELESDVEPIDVNLLEERLIEAKVTRQKIRTKLGWDW